MNVKMPSGNTLILPAERIVIDQERGTVDINQRSVWWNCYTYGGRDEEGTVYAGEYIETIHNDGHKARRRKT